MNPQVIGAIFRRNFVSYFSTPTGYVFVCVFVFLSSVAAFWPNEFFANNLANLDQLNFWLPLIMLVFIPAVTMSVWAEERRQGTDELLLTLPADDLDVVLGKFLSATAIFTASLLFSLISVLFVMQVWLGYPDVGLFLGNYFGYWVVGVAMLSIGMVASFLTSNLTVGFILGALFNAPLVILSFSNVIISNNTDAQALSRFGISAQFRDFGQGVISITSLSYFAMIVAVSLYLCLVLIGRRHWLGGRDGHSLLGHFIVRAVALVIAAYGLNTLLSHADARLDVSSGQISKLSASSHKLLAELDPKRPVVIDAYVSPEVPENLVQTRVTLLNVLREIERAADKKVTVKIHAVESLSDEATLAEKNFGIKPQRVLSRSRATIKQEDVFMGVALTSGLEKTVLPFLDVNSPVEYEVIHALSVVSKKDRKRLGILTTDVELFGGFNMQSFNQRPKQPIIEELEKQYTVEKVDPSKPITEHYDVLLAVQPSSLAPGSMENFINCVKGGQPTVILEDPLPAAFDAPGTTMPKTPPSRMGMMGGQPPGQKGDISPLWQFLGIDWVGKIGKNTDPFSGGGGEKFENLVVWQNFNPYPKLADVDQVGPEFIFVSPNMPNAKDEAFNSEDPITSHLQELLFFYAGGIEKQSTSKMKFTALVRTGAQTGTISPSDCQTAMQVDPSVMASLMAPKRVSTLKPYVLAARIRGPAQPAKKDDKPKDKEPGKDTDNQPNGAAADDKARTDEKRNGKPAGEKTADGKKPEEKKSDSKKSEEKKSADKVKSNKEKSGKDKADKPAEVDVVLISDVDIISDFFFRLRSHGSQSEDDIRFNMDNVVFILNALDVLAGDEKFVELRKRKPEMRRLVKIEDRTADARRAAADANKTAKKEHDDAMEKAKGEVEKINHQFEDDVQKLQKNAREGIDFRRIQEAQMRAQEKAKALAKKIEQDERELDEKYNQSVTAAKREETKQVRAAQQASKLWAVLLPPIPPLIVAFLVFFGRRAREQEGVARSRLR